jgi:hypothetical protein
LRQFHFDLKVKTGISLFHLTPTLSYQGEGDKETLWQDNRECQVEEQIEAVRRLILGLILYLRQGNTKEL